MFIFCSASGAEAALPPVELTFPVGCLSLTGTDFPEARLSVEKLELLGRLSELVLLALEGRPRTLAAAFEAAI